MSQNYVLMTSARDEQDFIAETIEAVVAQDVKPVKWVIVSDGSTDKTDEIVTEYAQKHPFIDFVRRDSDDKRDFSSKVKALELAYSRMEGLDYRFISNLDADIVFKPHYYGTLLDKFETNDKLGIAGGDIYDMYNGEYVKLVKSEDSVSGGLQFFRRECFEDVKGYLPLELGGEDMVAEILARKKGWEVKTFYDIAVYHQRFTGTGGHSMLKGRFVQGEMEYINGYHILYELVKFVFRIPEKPFFISSLARLLGFLNSYVRRRKRKVPDSIADYIQKEQLGKIKKLLRLR